jgi:protein translocase SecG subunit
MALAMGEWVRYIAFGIYFIVCVTLIALVVSQTTKHEGLGGTIGGSSSTSFRGRPGVEEQLSKYTGYAAGAFFFLSLLMYILVEKWKI